MAPRRCRAHTTAAPPPATRASAARSNGRELSSDSETGRAANPEPFWPEGRVVVTSVDAGGAVVDAEGSIVVGGGSTVDEGDAETAVVPGPAVGDPGAGDGEPGAGEGDPAEGAAEEGPPVTPQVD